MTAPDLVSAELDAEDRAHQAHRVRLCAWLSIAGFMLFVLLDRLVAPERLLPMLGVRAATEFLLIFVLGLTYLDWGARRLVWLALVVFLICSLSIIALDALAGGAASQYHEPLALMFVSYAALMPTTVGIVAPAMVGLVMVFAGTMMFLGVAGPTKVFASNVAVLALAAVISVFFAYLGGRLRRRERQARGGELTSRRQLAATNIELARAAEELKVLDRTKSEFFANVNHELRTPLTMVLAHTELATDEAHARGQTSISSHLEAVQRSGSRLLGLVQDMLDLTRLELNKLTLSRAPCDFVQLCEVLVEDIRQLAQRKEITLSFQLPPGWELRASRPAPIDIDAGQIDRILINLLNNAIKFTDPGGDIWLELGASDDRLWVEVRDSGRGIAPEALPRVFERGFQEPGSRSGGGLGIGLSLVRLIAEAHGGEVTAQSTLGKGSTFRLYLPTAFIPAGEERQPRGYLQISPAAQKVHAR